MSMFTSQIMALSQLPSHDFKSCDKTEIILTDPILERTLILQVIDVSERYSNDMELMKTINPKGVISGLLDIYERIEEETNSQSAKLCKKGCPDCCTNDVAISVIEFFHILNHIGVKYGEDFVKECSKKAKSFNLTSRCIFIDSTSSICKAYEVRPIICRKYGLYKTFTDCPHILADNQAKNSLITSEILLEENIDYFHIGNKRIINPSKTLHYWFANLDDNGEIKTNRMNDLFKVAFSGETADFIKILLA